jgi:hypothetical protein
MSDKTLTTPHYRLTWGRECISVQRKLSRQLVDGTGEVEVWGDTTYHEDAREAAMIEALNMLTKEDGE